jgi:hypothetical protein
MHLINQQFDLFKVLSHPYGIFQNKYNYVVETKLETICNKKLVGKKRPFFSLIDCVKN